MSRNTRATKHVEAMSADDAKALLLRVIPVYAFMLTALNSADLVIGAFSSVLNLRSDYLERAAIVKTAWMDGYKLLKVLEGDEEEADDE